MPDETVVRGAISGPDRPDAGTPRRRPRVLIGAVATIAGAVTIVVGAFSTWFSIGPDAYDGFATFRDVSEAGAITFVSLAIVVGGVGLITVIARRIVPIALVGAGVAALAVGLAVRRRGELQDAADRYAGVIEVGPGTLVIAVGAAAAALGSLLVVAVRRRP